MSRHDTRIATIWVAFFSRWQRNPLCSQEPGLRGAAIHLEPQLAERRLYPAIDIPKSGTRKEEKLFPEEHLDAIHKLRRTMVDLDPVQAMETLIGALKKHGTNAELLSKLKT